MEGAVSAASAPPFVLPASISGQNQPGGGGARGAEAAGLPGPGEAGAEREPRGTGARGARGAGAGPAGRGSPDPPPSPAPPPARSPEPGARPVRSAAERGHGLPAEPAEQPGGGERRGAVPRQAGERPGRLPPLVAAAAPAEAARGAAESLARALRAAGGVAAGDPGHHPGAQAGARRAHPPAAQEGTCGGMRDAGCGRGRDKGPCGAAGAAVQEPPAWRWVCSPPWGALCAAFLCSVPRSVPSVPGGTSHLPVMNMNIPDPQLARLPGHREGLEGAARGNVQEKGGPGLGCAHPHPSMAARGWAQD